MERIVSFGFLAPPTILITLCVVGALIALRWRIAGLAVLLASSLVLFAVATPAVSSWLLRQAEAGLPSQVDFRGAQAIVVLGGGMRPGTAARFPIGCATARMSAWHLPPTPITSCICRSRSAAGRRHGHASEAALMKAALESEFGVPVAWLEDQSLTTWENAVFSAAMLHKAGIDKIVVVTHRWHLPRALRSFERAGMPALPWPSPRPRRSAAVCRTICRAWAGCRIVFTGCTNSSAGFITDCAIDRRLRRTILSRRMGAGLATTGDGQIEARGGDRDASPGPDRGSPQASRTYR